jgi:hypothetical protein
MIISSQPGTSNQKPGTLSKEPELIIIFEPVEVNARTKSNKVL